jgi:hypothetical protein
MNPREQFGKETGKNAYLLKSAGLFSSDYVIWLEKELSNLGFAEPIKQSNPNRQGR